jgi:hypothetical protein
MIATSKESKKERADVKFLPFFGGKGYAVAGSTADSTLTRTEGESCLLRGAGDTRRR